MTCTAVAYAHVRMRMYKATRVAIVADVVGRHHLLPEGSADAHQQLAGPSGLPAARPVPCGCDVKVPARTSSCKHIKAALHAWLQ